MIRTCILLALVLNMIFCSCTKEMEYPLTVENQLVLNAIIKPWEPIVFHVSTTANMLDDYSDDGSNYRLKFFTGSQLLLDTLIKNGVYTSEFYGGGVSHYSATLEKDGFSTLSAEDSIPAMVFIENAVCDYPTGYVQDYGTYGTLKLTFTDPIATDDYYELIGSFSLEMIHYQPEILTEPVLKNEGDIDYLPTSLFFSDELFNGETYTLHISGAFPNGKVYLRHTSKNYYLYRKYYTRHAYNQQFQGDFWTTIFMGEPQTMFTNIENGYGIFAGYSEHSTNVISIK